MSAFPFSFCVCSSISFASLRVSGTGRPCLLGPRDMVGPLDSGIFIGGRASKRWRSFSTLGPREPRPGAPILREGPPGGGRPASKDGGGVGYEPRLIGPLSGVLSIEYLFRLSCTGSSLVRESLMLPLPDAQVCRDGPSWMLSGSNVCKMKIMNSNCHSSQQSWHWSNNKLNKMWASYDNLVGILFWVRKIWHVCPALMFVPFDTSSTIECIKSVTQGQFILSTYCTSKLSWTEFEIFLLQSIQLCFTEYEHKSGNIWHFQKQKHLREKNGLTT